MDDPANLLKTFWPHLARENSMANEQHEPMPPTMLIRCHTCEHEFDAMDDRAFIHTEGKLALCPYCYLQLHSAEAWTVWNDCQGVWPETVQPRKAGAEKFLKTTHGHIGGYVVPVRIFREREHEESMRNWHEHHEYGNG